VHVLGTPNLKLAPKCMVHKYVLAVYTGVKDVVDFMSMRPEGTARDLSCL